MITSQVRVLLCPRENKMDTMDVVDGMDKEQREPLTMDDPDLIKCLMLLHLKLGS